MADCSEIKARLDEVDALIECLSQPGVRSVRDSDGSEIQYSLGNITALQKKRDRIQQEYDACRFRGGPFRFRF